MRNRVLRALKFALERWIQRGVLHQLLLMAALIGAIALAGGVVAWTVSARFGGLGEAVWWAFLRLTDPGYLGDDEGAALRTVSTVVTVLGYVVFMGSLIAILTQWLARTIRGLESGLTPISMRGHVVVLGWTNRTLEIVLKLLEARGRLQRFLARRATDQLRIVIQSEEVGAERRLELIEHLGRRWDERRIHLRSGSSLRPEDLRRLDIARAAVVVVPGADFARGGAELSDTRVVKTLLGLQGLLGPEGGARPELVAEVFDPLKATIAREALGGGAQVVCSDLVLSRLISQSVRHPGLARILFGLLSHRQGSSLYVRGFPALAGARLAELTPAFGEAVVLGLLRREDGRLRAHLDPAEALHLEEGDLLVLLGPSYERCEPASAPAPAPPSAPPGPRRMAPRGRAQRLLVLGWSHKAPAIVRELDEGANAFEVTVLSRLPIAEREQALARARGPVARVTVHHVEGDCAFEADLAAVAPEGFDSVLFLASAQMASSEEADARTLLGYLVLSALLRRTRGEPEILVELLDPDSLHIFAETEDTVLVSPRVVSHLLAHVALRPELALVFDEIFGAGGAEIDLVRAGELGLVGPLAFPALQSAALAQGRVALGLVLAADRSVHLNPERTRTFALTPEDQVVVLSVE
ncbi:MAG TPA: ion channel DMI1 [Planctomycetota bacterium]